MSAARRYRRRNTRRSNEACASFPARRLMRLKRSPGYQKTDTRKGRRSDVLRCCSLYLFSTSLSPERLDLIRIIVTFLWRVQDTPGHQIIRTINEKVKSRKTRKQSKGGKKVAGKQQALFVSQSCLCRQRSLAVQFQMISKPTLGKAHNNAIHLPQCGL